ncbi:PBECR3 domain-containing polyvalent protein, partial [Helicobacter pylori]|uniref:putative barnase/colicin E5 family endoribonuclease n=2 Tax=Helicobacter pylori TaxID=210 RepID=UPI00117B3562
KGLKDFKIADVTKDMFNPDSKEFKDIDIYDFTHYLLMANREPNENNPTLKRLIEAVKDMQKESEKGIKKPKLETPSEWGNDYSEFKGDGLGAINKLLETKKGFVAGAFYKEGLGDIDLVWGNKDYGLEHILKRRIESYIKKGLKPKFAEQRALNLVRMMPEVIEKGKVGRDAQGRLKIEIKDILVALRDNWQGEPLENKWVITGFEKKVGNIREQAKFIDPSLITKDGEHLASSLNSVEPNPTTNGTKKQESEQANAEKLRKLESEKKIKAEAVKKLHFDEIKKLIDESPNNGKDIIVIGNDNLTPEIVESIHKKHAKVGIERLDEDEITAFNFTYPKNAKAIIDYQGIQHALNKHGINSPSVKFSKQPPITYKDISNYRDIVKNADETIKRDNRIISYKQVNGHFVVVEQINRNKSEFIFKTMFKEKGDYKNAPDYKKNIKEND